MSENTSLINTLGVICQVTDILSALGSLFNIITTISFKIHKTEAGKMVIGISLMDIIYSIADFWRYYLISESTKKIAFWVQFSLETGRLGSIFWCCCFAHSFYSTVMSGSLESVRKYMRKYVIIGIAFPFLFGLIFYAVTSEETDAFSYDVKIKDLFQMTIPLFLAIFYCLGCYVAAIRHLRRFEGQIHTELLLFPIILVICNFPESAFLIYLLASGKRLNDLIFIFGLIAILTNSQGLLNSIVYGNSAKIRNQLKQKCCKKRNDTQALSFYTDRVYPIASDSSDESMDDMVISKYKAFSWTKRSITTVPNSL